ncbi:MAG TPA: SAM-dependent methyltransferase [Verrucomicrobia bacterium]|nr:MAG: SAM-dependent methyltransferase [Lentisphaerae bacterium GWF2_57_35]HBA84541.1 SAM-dependent methyltransferase [Verrucomicrobiota bacterium]
MTDKSYKWNPADYAKNSSAQFQWAKELIAKLELRGDESLLDIGCGDGKVTAAIAACLPRGAVIGVDSSPEMIELANTAYSSAEFRNLFFQRMDARELTFEDQFDVVFSNAALHWVTDHVSVLRGVKRSLKPSGKLLFQMGGKGNAAEIVNAQNAVFSCDPWRPYFEGFAFPYGFYGPEEYRPWLLDVGLKPERIEIFPKDMTQAGREGLAGWVRTTWLPYTERLPEELRESFVYAVVDAYLATHPLDAQGLCHVKMMRLEVEASNEEARLRKSRATQEKPGHL